MPSAIILIARSAHAPNPWIFHLRRVRHLRAAHPAPREVQPVRPCTALAACRQPGLASAHYRSPHVRPRRIHAPGYTSIVRFQSSIEGRFVLLAVTLSVASLLVALGLAWWSNSLLDGLLLGLLLAVVLSVFAVRRFMRRTNRILTALDDGMASFQDGDFSVSLNAGRDDELGRLVAHYNLTGERLRGERQSPHPREL